MEEDLTRLLKGTPDSLKYELAIWKTKGFSSEETEASGAKVIHSDSMVERPGSLCYHRTDLINTEHVVETPLEPNTLYLWSVRVKAERGGQAYLTEWATFNSNLNYGIFGLPVETTVVTGAMWRFKTPKVEK